MMSLLCYRQYLLSIYSWKKDSYPLIHRCVLWWLSIWVCILIVFIQILNDEINGGRKLVK